MPVLSAIDENCLSERRRLVGDTLRKGKISSTIEKKQVSNMAANGASALLCH